MADTSGSQTSEDSGVPENSEANELSPNFVLVPELAPNMVDHGQDFVSQIQVVLVENDIDEDATEWILNHFHLWKTIDEINGSEDLSTKKIRLLKSTMGSLFENFNNQRSEFLNYLVSIGIEPENVWNSTLLRHWSGGPDCLRGYIFSEEAVENFSESSVSALRTAYLADSTGDIATSEVCESVDVSRKVEHILQECLSNHDAIQEVLSKFSSFDDLEKGLESCEELNKKQIKVLVEKLGDVFTEMREGEADAQCNQQDYSFLFQDLGVPKEAVDWINQWLRSNVDSNVDLSYLDECEDLTKKQLKIVKDKLSAFLQLEKAEANVESTQDPEKVFLNEVALRLQEVSGLDESVKDWILNNIATFQSLADLETSEDLTKKQIRHLKSVLQDSFDAYMEQTAAREQQCTAFLSKIEDEVCEKLGYTLLEGSVGESSSSVQPVEQVMDVDGASFEVLITPLILFHTELQENFSVEKFILSENGVKHICNMVPEELRGDTPIFYNSVTSGDVIDFRTMDKLTIGCVGLFGPLKAVVRNFKGYVPESKLDSLERSISAQKCGLYLIEAMKCKKNFLVFKSDDETEFKLVRKDSRAVHFLRYMSQLCNNVIMCLDENYEDRLTSSDAKVVVKCDRRSRYNLKKHELQQESFTLKNLGFRGDNLLCSSKIYCTENGLILAKFEKVEAFLKPRKNRKFGTVSEMKSIIESGAKIECLDDICYEFKQEYLKEFHSGKMEKIKSELENQIEAMRSEAEKSAIEIVMFSVAIYFLKECDFDLQFELLKNYFKKNSKVVHLWEKRIFFNMHTINDPLIISDEIDLKKDLRNLKANDRTVEKFLLWTALAKTEEGITDEEVLAKGCNDATWKEIKNLGQKQFSSSLFFMTDRNISQEMKQTVESLNYENPSELLETTVNSFLEKVCDLIQPFASKSKFVTYCRKHTASKFEVVRKEKSNDTVQKLFGELMVERSENCDENENSDVIKCISSTRSNKFECLLETSAMEPAKTTMEIHQLALSRSEHQKLSTTEATLNVREIEFHRTGIIQYPETNTLVACYPLEGSSILLLFNVSKVSKTVVYNLPNVSKPQLDLPFGKIVSASAYDSKARVLAVQSEMEPGIVQLFKFGEDYKSRHGLKPLELNRMFGVETIVECCLQPNSRFLWFMHDGRLRKMDYKSGTMVNKALKFDETKSMKLKATPDGSCVLVINEEEGSAKPVMTETGNMLDAVENISDKLCLLLLCGQMIAFQSLESCFSVHQIVVTGAQHQTKLNKKGGRESQNVNSTGTEDCDEQESHWIDYIYWMLTKFPCNDLLQPKQENLNFWISPPISSSVLNQQLVSGINSIWNRLQMTKKPLDFLKLRTDSFFCSLSEAKELEVNQSCLGKFLIKLITFIPVQIARCQSNEFYILENGQPVSLEHVNVAFDLIERIKLGFYESIFNAWSGEIKVISSMGKQTTGKSYTLNHLTGSSFNIAGTRCTDGCWMTVKEHDDCLYVILDFEGLGSFERTEQDDMLLSLFNSAVSTITIFKTEKRLDRDVDKMFNKINLGSDQLKGTDKVFKGKFMIVINDVAEQDVKDTPKEFEEKISNIVGKSENNFIKKLYNSDFEIMAFPAFESVDYYESMMSLMTIIQDEVDAVFHGGPEFLSTLKLLMAKLAINDFSSLDRQQIDERVRFLRSLLPFAIQFGQISDDYPKKKELDLKSLDNPAFEIPTEKQIELKPLGPVTLKDFDIVFKDSQMDDLVLSFLSLLEPKAENVDAWREGLENFVMESIVFRFERVRAWLDENLRKWKDSDNSEHQDIIKVSVENLENFEVNFQQSYKFCDEKCKECFLKCTQIMNHKNEHRCSTNHRCTASCYYCEDGRPCKLSFGHEGKHLCADMNHVCSEPCRFNHINDCPGECQKMTGHDEEHECSEKKHPCKEICSLDSCEGRCVINCEEEHLVHKCTKEECINKCCVKTCTNKCSALDHFHGHKLSQVFKEEQGIVESLPFRLDNGELFGCEEHFCGKEHQCDQDCMHDGYCHVWTEKQLKDETFEGKRDTFTYSLKFVEKGEKLKCRRKLKPFTKLHEGGHSCSTEVHFCMKICPTCENICSKAVNHENDGDVFHHARHGNMRKCFFVASEDDIQVGSHKYKVGEPAVAEMCHIFCNTLGRGHIHIVECDSEDPSTCVYSAKSDGRRHQTTYYQPNPEIPKDEITHESYWISIGFQDPCQESDCEDFEKCPAYCAAETHEKDEETSYCELGIWHEPIRTLSEVGRTSGILTEDGHVFPCSHPSGMYHFVLCLDDSGSMAGPPWRELVSAVQTFVSQRMATSSRDMLSIAIHNHETRIKAEFIPITSFSASLLDFRGGENDFSLALRVSDGLIGRHLESHVKPVLIFMSDGIWYNGEVEMEAIATKYRVVNGLEVYTLGFGSINFEKLRELAGIGKGQFIEAVNGMELKTAFVEISAKHPPTIGVSF